MPGTPDHYRVLGVSRAASPAEIRRAYLDRARYLHPDVGAAGTDERAMQQVNAAWQVLRDPRQRWAYDRELAGLGPATFRAGPAGGRSDAEPVVDLDDLLGSDRRPASSLPEDAPTAKPAIGDLHVLLPPALLLGAVGSFALAAMESSEGLFAMSMMLFLASVVSFLLAPFVSLARGRRRR